MKKICSRVSVFVIEILYSIKDSQKTQMREGNFRQFIDTYKHVCSHDTSNNEVPINNLTKNLNNV
jgi:hypothetical protein